MVSRIIGKLFLKNVLMVEKEEHIDFNCLIYSTMLSTYKIAITVKQNF